MVDVAAETTFLFSDWYSGATLLAILLDNHPEMTCNGETLPFLASEAPLYNCTCGVPLLRCTYYREAALGIFEPLDERGVDPDFAILPPFSRVGTVNRLLQGFRRGTGLRDAILGGVPGYRGIAERFVDKHLRFVARCLELDGTRVYVDGTKSIRRAELFCERFPGERRVIHLVRDGRAFCHSFVRHQRHLGKGLDDAIRRWSEYNEMVDRFRRRFPEIPFLLVRYEDLCRDTAGSLAAICRFNGVDSEVDLAVAPTPPFHVLGNKMRKAFDGTVRENRAWETELSAGDRTRIEGALGDSLERFGYLES